MSWFKVDDGFYGSDKVLLIPRAQRAEAVGTWTLCGTWSADKERDGFVPTHIVEEVGATIPGADALVAVKLWRKRAGGYQFVNWEKYQPTRAENDARREKDASRQAAYRDRQKARKDADESADVTPLRSRSSSLPSRSRPDPSRPDDDQSSRGKSRAVIHSGDDPVSNSLVSKVVGVCAEHGVTIHPLVVPDLIDFIEQRRGPRAAPIQAVDRYFPGAIRDSWPEVEQFIHQRGLAS
jgi:hypothetical protein